MATGSATFTLDLLEKLEQDANELLVRLDLKSEAQTEAAKLSPQRSPPTSEANSRSTIPPAITVHEQPQQPLSQPLSQPQPQLQQTQAQQLYQRFQLRDSSAAVNSTTPSSTKTSPNVLPTSSFLQVPSHLQNQHHNRSPPVRSSPTWTFNSTISPKLSSNYSPPPPRSFLSQTSTNLLNTLQEGSISNDRDNRQFILPNPVTHVAHEKALYYTDYLIHRKPEVRFSSLKALYNLIAMNESEMKSVHGNIVQGIISCLDTYHHQPAKFNKLAVQTLSHIGGTAALSSISSLLRLLKDPSQYEVYEDILQCIFSMGKNGIEKLLQSAADATSEWDMLMLSHLANHPVVIRNVIVPALVKECAASDLSRREAAVRALSKLTMKAAGALAALVDILVGGTIDRALVASAIRNTGQEGEKVLIYLLANNPSPRVRACAALALGQEPPQESTLKVVVNAAFTHSFTTPPRLAYYAVIPPADAMDELPEDYLMFDARELVNACRRTLEEDLFPYEDEPTEKFMDPKITDLVMYVLNSSKRDHIATVVSTLAGIGISSNAPANIISSQSLEPLRYAWLKRMRKQTQTAEQQSGNVSQNASPDKTNSSFNSISTLDLTTTTNASGIDIVSGGTPPSVKSVDNRSKVDVNSSNTLGSTNNKNGMDSLRTTAIIDALVNALQDFEESIRQAAAQSIGNLGVPSHNAIVAIIRALRDQSNKVRSEAVEALGKIGNPFIDPHYFQHNIAVALGSSNFSAPNTTAIDYIAPLLKDGYWNVRHSACLALRHFKSEGHLVIPFLIKALKDGTVNRLEAAETVISTGDKGAQALISLVKQTQNSSQVRISGVHGLGFAEITSPIIDRVVESLFEASRDRIPLVRKAVISALGRLAARAKESLTYLRAKSLLPFLYNFLKDKNQAVGEEAAVVLGQSGPHGELLLIEGLLKDPNPIIRATAAYGLMHVGPRTIRTLLLALNDPEPIVCQSVGNTIVEIGVPAIVNTLLQRPKSHRDSVVASAREVLSSPIHLNNSQDLQKTLANLITRLEAIAD